LGSPSGYYSSPWANKTLLLLPYHGSLPPLLLLLRVDQPHHPSSCD